MIADYFARWLWALGPVPNDLMNSSRPTTRPALTQRNSNTNPTAESTAAIRELARAEGVFVGLVYNRQGLGWTPPLRPQRPHPADSNVAFLDTGDTGNLCEIPEVVGHITKRSAAGASRSASATT